MKKAIFLLLAGVLALTAFHSCDDDFLKEEPTRFVSPANFYTSPEEAQLVVNGCYDAISPSFGFQQYGYPVFWSDCGVDIDLIPSWGNVSLGTYTLQPTNSYVKGMWQILYAAIQKHNVAINQIGQMDEELFWDLEFGDETILLKDVMLGEVHFLRAICYFYLEMIYGNIPLVLDETESFGSEAYVYQETPENIYASIISDLEIAEQNLPWVRPAEEAGKVSKGAVKAMLGNVYLQMTGFPLHQPDKFSLAAAKYKEVIDKAEGEGLYELLPVYADVFDYLNPNNAELIFSVQYLTGSEGGWTGTLQGQVGDISKGGGYETTYVNWDFVASHDTLDVRFAHNMTNISATTGKLTGSGIYGPWKYHKPNPNDWGINTPIDWPLIRYADVLAGYAEALNGANAAPPAEAYRAINLIRERARHADHKTDGTVLPDLADMTKEEFVEALIQENAWEFCWEGKRKQILIRTGKLKEYITPPRFEPQFAHGYYYDPGLNFDENTHYWYPIPQHEMDINPNLVQNPGY
jgi:starch-binding outer membrane protein, SusD/RagB family